MPGAPSNDATPRMIRDVSFGSDVVVAPFTNLYGCEIGDRSRIGPFVEIQAGVVIGADCKIQSHSFLCEGVTIEDEVFVGHGVVFVNDKNPRATNAGGELAGPEDWELQTVTIRRGAALGSGAVIMGGVEVGASATVGAGAVVVRDVEAETVVAGNPARPLR
jgi:UDP-2-acetamido-3-amino-2,3-dideoxy-glucuronate N-acetyltransferase